MAKTWVICSSYQICKRTLAIIIHVVNAAGDFSSKLVYQSEKTELLLGSDNHKCDLRVKAAGIGHLSRQVLGHMQFILPR